MAPTDPDSPQAGDELGVQMQTCVDHLGCHLGALVVPERNIAVCKAPNGERPQVEILTKIRRHLLNWVQLQRRNLVINKIKVRPIELPPYKILCTPVRHASGRVIGFLALFRAENAPGFDPRTERLVELLSRKTTTTLQNNFDQLTALLTRSAFETQVRGVLAARRQRRIQQRRKAQLEPRLAGVAAVFCGVEGPFEGIDSVAQPDASRHRGLALRRIPVGESPKHRQRRHGEIDFGQRAPHPDVPKICGQAAGQMIRPDQPEQRPPGIEVGDDPSRGDVLAGRQHNARQSADL